MATTEEFLKPESMVTPGVAGAMTMGITNALSAQFNILAPGPAYVGLAISFLFGLCVFSNKEMRVPTKLAFWVLNSLIIFMVAAGSNSVGREASGAAATRSASTGTAILDRVSDVLVSRASAQAPWCCAEGKATQISADECQRRKGTVADSEAKAKQQCVAARREAAEEKKRPFFRVWVGRDTA